MKIIMDGTPTGTKVLDDNDRLIDSVFSVDIHHSAGGLPEVVLNLNLVKVDACSSAQPRYYLSGYGYLRSVELEDGTKIDLHKERNTL